MLLAVAEWVFFSGLEVAARELWAKVLWGQITYIGLVSSVPLFIWFVLSYSGQSKWLTRRNAFLIWIIPLISLLLAFTNQWHYLHWDSYTPVVQGGLNLIVYGHNTVWFFVFTAYNYLLIGVGIVHLAPLAIRAKRLYRLQGLILLIGSLIPFLANAVYILGFSPVVGMDTTPFAFAATGVMLAWGIFGEPRLADLVPVARDLLIENLSDCVLVVDVQNRVADINPAARAFLSLGEKGVIGHPAAEALAPWPDLAERYRDTLEVSEEITLVVPHARDLEIRIVPLCDARGGARGRLIVWRDVTERNRVAAERRKLEESLWRAQQVESLGVLAGGIAHHFNNLLTVILGNAELVRMDTSLDAELVARLDKIIAASSRAASLSAQMLSFAGRARRSTTMVDLNQLVRETEELLRLIIPPQAALRLELGTDSPVAHADASQLQQVLLDLVTNAAEALPESGGTITLRTAVDDAATDHSAGALLRAAGLPEGRYARLEIADTGRGMDEATLARAFEPFFSTKFSGRGLGLSAALGIARAQQGTIHVTSTPGQGTVVRAWLPC
jgi:PAS domain S-box-containing protein